MLCILRPLGAVIKIVTKLSQQIEICSCFISSCNGKKHACPFGSVARHKMATLFCHTFLMSPCILQVAAYWTRSGSRSMLTRSMCSMSTWPGSTRIRYGQFNVTQNKVLDSVMTQNKVPNNVMTHRIRYRTVLRHIIRYRTVLRHTE